MLSATRVWSDVKATAPALFGTGIAVIQAPCCWRVIAAAAAWRSDLTRSVIVPGPWKIAEPAQKTVAPACAAAAIVALVIPPSTSSSICPPWPPFSARAGGDLGFHLG